MVFTIAGGSFPVGWGETSPRPLHWPAAGNRQTRHLIDSVYTPYYTIIIKYNHYYNIIECHFSIDIIVMKSEMIQLLSAQQLMRLWNESVISESVAGYGEGGRHTGSLHTGGDDFGIKLNYSYQVLRLGECDHSSAVRCECSGECEACGGGVGPCEP